MATATTTVKAPAMTTVADVLARLDDIPADRIRLVPAAGKATPKDALRIREKEGKLCEVIDGVLVEKPMSYFESLIAAMLVRYLDEFVERFDLGIVTGADGPLFVDPKQMRYPDVAFFSWSKFPGRVLPVDSILDHVPDVSVEVISPSNTRKEMERKRRENFAGGCKLIWEVFAGDRRIDVYTSPDQFVSRRDGDTLDGGDVLPGFALEVTKLFDRAGRRA